MKELKKVSVCIPAYNKEDAINAMLRSVCEQKYNNIEVIIVNNGSTDDTPDIIFEWKPIFIERGYEVVIVDRPNRGLPDSAKTLLQLAAGDYICMPDADDILHPEYVSAMAEVLNEQEDVMWVMCYGSAGTAGLGEKTAETVSSVVDDSEHFLKLFLAHFAAWAVWTKMFRADYMRKSEVIGKFIVDHPLQTHEQQIGIPLICGGGKGYILQRRLYAYMNPNEYARDLSVKELRILVDKAADLSQRVLALFKKDTAENVTLCKIAAVKRMTDLTRGWNKEDISDEMLTELTALLNTSGLLKTELTQEAARAVGWDRLVNSIKTGLSYTGKASDSALYIPFIFAVPETRIIAVGKGNYYDSLEPFFQNMPFKIDVHYEDIEDFDADTITRDDKVLLFDEYENDEVEKLKAAAPWMPVYNPGLVTDFILQCNYKSFCSRYYLSSVNDEELKAIFGKSDGAGLCIWGYGTYGRQLCARFGRLGIKCEVTDMRPWLWGKEIPDQTKVKKWNEIKANIKTVIIGASGQCRSISGILDKETEVYAVNG